MFQGSEIWGPWASHFIWWQPHFFFFFVYESLHWMTLKDFLCLKPNISQLNGSQGRFLWLYSFSLLNILLYICIGDILGTSVQLQRLGVRQMERQEWSWKPPTFFPSPFGVSWLYCSLFPFWNILLSCLLWNETWLYLSFLLLPQEHVFLILPLK